MYMSIKGVIYMGLLSKIRNTIKSKDNYDQDNEKAYDTETLLVDALEDNLDVRIIIDDDLVLTPDLIPEDYTGMSRSELHSVILKNSLSDNHKKVNSNDEVDPINGFNFMIKAKGLGLNAEWKYANLTVSTKHVPDDYKEMEHSDIIRKIKTNAIKDSNNKDFEDDSGEIS